MRTISLVNRLKWSFSGNMNPHALVLGDVDNDGDIEFALGNLRGDLVIFKGECEQGQPTFICSGLGTITCLAIGDIRNCGKNSTVVINAEGLAHIFDIPPPSEWSTMYPIFHHPPAGPEEGNKSGSVYSQERTSVDKTPLSHPTYNLQKPNLTLKVPVNVNKILIADVDGDALNELVLARTDRILHAFQLVATGSPSADSLTHPHPKPTSSTPASALSSNSSPNISQQSHASIPTPISGKTKKESAHADSRPPLLKHGIGRTKDKSPSARDSSRSADMGQRLTTKADKVDIVEKDMWIFDGQITSLASTILPERPNEPILLVAQPGNTFTIIDRDGNRYHPDFTLQQPDRNHRRPKASQSGSSSDQDSLQPNTAQDTNDMETVSPSRKEAEEIRTMLQQSQQRQGITSEQASDYVVSDASGDSHTVHDSAGNEMRRSNYVVQNWSEIDSEEMLNHEDNGAVATEIVVGRRRGQTDVESGNEVGMLSMDGRFTIYDLSTKTTSQCDLLVTHKLFSLSTLDVSESTTRSVRKKSTALPNMRTSAPGSPQSKWSTTSHPSDSPKIPETQPDDTSQLASLAKLNRVRSNPATETGKNADTSNSNGHPLAGFHVGDPETLEVLTDAPHPMPHGLKKRGSVSSTRSTAATSWSDVDDRDDLPECDLFVACAWNGLTYLIDWSQRVEGSTQIKYQRVKFAFSGRVCAFIAGLYAVVPGSNVPCLFYVDFEDQIFLYYNVRIAPGPVTGMTEAVDEDIAEAIERIADLEHNTTALLASDEDTKDMATATSYGDLGRTALAKLMENDSASMAEFVHGCMNNFDDLRLQMEKEMDEIGQGWSSRRFPASADLRRLSDLNIRVGPSEPETPIDTYSREQAYLSGRRHRLPSHTSSEEEESWKPTM